MNKEITITSKVTISIETDFESTIYDMIDLIRETGGKFVTYKAISQDDFIKKRKKLIKEYNGELLPTLFTHPMFRAVKDSFIIQAWKTDLLNCCVSISSIIISPFTEKTVMLIFTGIKKFIKVLSKHFDIKFALAQLDKIDAFPHPSSSYISHLHWYNYINKKMIPDISLFKKQLPDYFTIQEDGNFWEIQAKQTLSETLEKPIFLKLKQPLQMVKDI